VISRLVLVLAIVSAAIAALIGFEGARETDRAFAALSASQTQPKDAGTDQRLQEAGRRLEQNWARPLLWNAYSNEALSAIYARRFEVTGERAMLAQSTAYARHALHLSPLLLQTWVRLAQLSLLDAPGTPCDALQCLETSWQIAPISDARTDCLRVQLAHEAGMDERRLREHIAIYARTDAPRAAVHCLHFLPPEERLSYGLRRHGR
jgi:hypothetical protein